MRSTLLLFASVVFPLAFAAIGASTGCSETSALSKASDSAQPADPSIANSGTDSSKTDAGANATKTPVLGSPLCNVTADTCLPDDVKSCAPEAADDVDAGTASPLVDGGRACRIGAGGKPTDDVAARCNESSTRSGSDGAKCERGSDCAAGFDCVDGEKGGVCRRYCCSGTCTDYIAHNGGPTFCDVQKLLDVPGHNAPVCMPLKTCTLLASGDCTDQETCAVVTDKGDTGCVTTGKREAGETCDAEHCVAGLTCLGNVGERRCYELCKRQSPMCKTGQTCVTGAAFESPTFGVCQ